MHNDVQAYATQKTYFLSLLEEIRYKTLNNIVQGYVIDRTN